MDDVGNWTNIDNSDRLLIKENLEQGIKVLCLYGVRFTVDQWIYHNIVHIFFYFNLCKALHKIIVDTSQEENKFADYKKRMKHLIDFLSMNSMKNYTLFKIYIFS